MNKRTIFFDLDDTLIDTSERHYQVYCDITKSLSLKTLNKDDFWNLKRNGTKNIEILKESKDEDLKKFSELWINNIEKKKYLFYDKLFNSASNFLSNLKKEQLILISMRHNRKNLIWETKKLGLYDHFDEVLSCSPLLYKDKTSPIIEYAHSKNLNLNNSIIVGDSEIDIITGKHLKMTTIAVTQGIRARKLLIPYNPDYCLENISKIANTLKNL